MYKVHASANHSHRWPLAARVAVVASMGVLAGCGFSSQTVKPTAGVVLKKDTHLSVAPVTNNTGQSFDIDIQTLLKDSLTKSLQKESMFSESATAALNCNVNRYAKGNAFARWLVPGAGATKLGIGCEVREGDKVLATAEAERSVLAGGGYTIGAWLTIFTKVANDLVGEIKRSLH